MPPIADAVDKNKARISAGGQTNAYAPAPASEIAQSPLVAPTPPQDLPVGGGLPQRGMFPAQFVLASDRSDSSRGFRTGGMRAAAFPYPNPTQSTEKVTNITTVVQTPAASTPAPTTNPVTPPPAPVAGAILLQTNGINNIDQDTLDLVATSPVTLAPDATGDVVISVPVMTGDSGSGGSTGLVPAPPAGSAAAQKFLKADGTYQIPPGTGGATNYQEVESAGTPFPPEPILNFLNAVIVDDPGNTSTDVTIPAIALFTNKPLASPVSMTSNIIAVIDSILTTMPAKGGPWYVRVSYFYAKKNGGNHVCWAEDNSLNMFAASQGGANNNNDALAASGLSPVTYANGASATFSVRAIDNNNSTVETDTSSEGGNPATSVSIPSYMQIEILSAG